MKTKLYKKFLKLVCKSLKISKKMLFARDFNEFIIAHYQFNVIKRKLEIDDSALSILNVKHPLSHMYKTFDFHTKWLLKYWRHSHWKPYVQMKIDLGIREEDAVLDILQGKVK